MGNTASSTRRHIVLLGDSTIDNGNWVAKGHPSVADQVRFLEPNSTMCARDGALIAAIRTQVEQAPTDATHFVVSIGENNVTGATITVLGGEVQNAEEAIIRLGSFIAAFEAEFSTAMKALHDRVGERPLVICSCYNPCFGPFEVTTVSQAAANTTMALVADAVLRVATRLGVPVVDLRRVLTGTGDFANPIEPSSAGGEKIGRAIVSVVRSHPFQRKTTVAYPQAYPESDLVVTTEGATRPGPARPAQQSVLDEPGTAAAAAGLRGAEAPAPAPP